MERVRTATFNINDSVRLRKAKSGCAHSGSPAVVKYYYKYTDSYLVEYRVNNEITECIHKGCEIIIYTPSCKLLVWLINKIRKSFEI